jgi:hypothetical protein
LLATEIAVKMTQSYQEKLKTSPDAINWNIWIGAVLFVVALFFVYRSFFGMRIPEERPQATPATPTSPAAPKDRELVNAKR